ncbi:hypothetical protein E3N88_11116 [Mikania micrantha]|uniref:RING-type E3 ubiquitin transferase n=1 Tax=Mikania micrantha TaxID=192012 RepID=A0A5N6PCM4_9ASTR|nr:hypothetical protein E3N88_11116 [Mikania micrantha]
MLVSPPSRPITSPSGLKTTTIGTKTTTVIVIRLKTNIRSLTDFDTAGSGMAEVGKIGVILKLIDIVNEISSISDYRSTIRKPFFNLSRRLKLLNPLFEEIRDVKEALPDNSFQSLLSLVEALESAKELLRLGSEGSKISLALEKDEIMKKYQEVTTRLEQDLEGISFEKLDISDEVKEQVALVLAQFRRAKGRTDAPDIELSEDLSSLYDKGSDVAVDPSVLKRLIEKLQLTRIDDLTHESIILHEMVTASDGDPGENIEKMSMLLKIFKDFVQTDNPNGDSPPGETSAPPISNNHETSSKSYKNAIIPDDFRCPISLELMKDPVIVSTGQTYERICIEKWLDAGHKTCPKTQQNLTSTVLIPNYVLRNDQRTAAGEIRLLAKRNADNRVAIAEAGAIPLLTHLLTAPDSRTQEHAVTALLNLSICEDNKGSIVSSGAVPGIVQVLKKGSMEARENAAATLFSLSVIDENKVTIGSLGAIPPLVLLLSEGNQRGKKDAATALFNLCIYQGNKGRAVRAGVINTLMELLTEPQGGMKDEALAILAILSSHPEGKVAIGKADAVGVLVEFIGSGSPRNKENAAAVLVHLCSGDHKHLVEAQELGVMEVLVDLLHHGTDRGKRKAAQLLEKITRFTEQQKLSQTSSQSIAETE